MRLSIRSVNTRINDSLTSRGNINEGGEGDGFDENDDDKFVYQQTSDIEEKIDTTP